MPQPLLRAVLTGSPDELETAFYDALQKGDLERVMACWADDDDIVCVHPGGARLLGVMQIRAAYAAILERGGLQVRPAQVVRVQALASSMHSVLEQVRIALPDGAREALLWATNVYHKTPAGWRAACQRGRRPRCTGRSASVSATYAALKVRSIHHARLARQSSFIVWERFDAPLGHRQFFRSLCAGPLTGPGPRAQSQHG